MRKRLAATVTAVLASFAALAASGTPAGADDGGVQWWQTPDASALTVAMNGSRNALGLATVPADGVLSYLAEVHAVMMSRAGGLYHQDLGAVQRATGCARIAENVGVAPTVAGANQALVNSPSHLANMTGAWRLVGIGVASNSGQKWVVELFCTW